MFITDTSNGNKTKSAFQRGMVTLLMSAILLTSAFSVGALNKTAVINADGETMTVNTMTTDTKEILANADIKVGKNDKVTTTEDNGVITINIARAFTVYTDINGTKTAYSVTGGTVGELVDNAGVTVTENHIVIPNKTTQLKENMTVKVAEYRTVSITVDNKTVTERVPVGTVKKALEYLDIKLSKNDVVSCDVEEAVTDGMEIQVTRVSYREVTTLEKIAFESETVYSDKLEKGKKKVSTKGVDGEVRNIVRQTLVSGVVVDAEYISYEVVKEAVNEVVTVGTKETATEPATEKATSQKQKTTKTTTKSETAQTITNENNDYDYNDYNDDNDSTETDDYDYSSFPTKNVGGNVFYDENGNAVSYTACYQGTGTAYTAPYGSLTATGNLACVGGVAVNPNIIPYGSKLYIVSDDGFVYGYATAIDTGGALMDGRVLVDVFYNTEDECYEFGRRDVTVYVLD